MNRSLMFRITVIAILVCALGLAAAAQEPRVPPTNNNFGARTIIGARHVMNGIFLASSAHEGSIETNEPVPSCSSSGSVYDTVWYQFTAPYQVQFTVDTFESTLNNSASNRNTVIALYNSSAGAPTLAQLTPVICSENGTNQGFFTWYPIPAGTYYLQVGSSSNLTTASTYHVEFGSRYQLLSNTGFGETSAQLAPWTVTNKSGDKVVCETVLPRLADLCTFRFKTSATENATLTYKMSGLASLPHDTGPTIYSEFVLDEDHFTERAQTNAKATITVTFQDGSKVKDSRSLDQIGAIYVDPLTGSTPTKLNVKIKHTGKSGKPLYITQVQVFYAPGSTGRDAPTGDALPLPAPAHEEVASLWP